MELNCPDCGAHFVVPDGAIGPKGRKLKCAKCGHTWRQMPPDQDSPPEAPSVAPPVAPRPPPRAEAPPRPEPPPLPPMPEDTGPPVPMEMEPGERKAPREAVDAGGLEPMDSDAASIADDIDDPLAGLDFGDGDGGGDDPLDGLSGMDAASDTTDTDIDDLLAADPEPIPEMFARDSGDDEKGGKKGKLLGVLLGLVILAGLVGGGLYFGRTFIVQTFPEAEPYYAEFGIPVEVLGVGLRFNDVTSERLVREGTDTLVVRGFIANTTTMTRELPFLRLVLFDATDAPVQDMVAEPPQATLAAGDTTGFRVQLENPSAAARRFEVDWTKPPGAE